MGADCGHHYQRVNSLIPYLWYGPYHKYESFRARTIERIWMKFCYTIGFLTHGRFSSRWYNPVGQYKTPRGRNYVHNLYHTSILITQSLSFQVVGHREGLEMMESADPLVLLVLLPTIPVTLISAKMYNWEDSVLLFLRKYCAKIPALSYVLPFGE